MNKQEIEQLQELNIKFQKECDEIAKKLVRVNDDFRYADDLWAVNGDCAASGGDVYCRNCFMEHVTVEFLLVLLNYTDQQLEQYIEQEREKQIKEYEQEENRKEANKIAQEKEKYERLKKKFGLEKELVN